MGESWTCPRGHRWETIATATSLAPGTPAPCPVCGVAGAPADGGGPLAGIGADPGATLVPQRDGPPPRAPAVGSVPGYEVFGELGRGGMGVVYKARHRALQRMVALKMVLAGPFADAESVARFHAEAAAVACLTHPNIVQIYEVGEAEGRPYFTMEYVNGRSLSQQLAGVPQPAEQAARWAEVLARAVQYAHDHGIIHRDLKPANVLVSPEGHLKITDFGLAKRINGGTTEAPTISGAVLGTPEYMAPEQAGGRGPVGLASDVYALGVILYEMLTGRRPFEAATPLGTLTLLLVKDPVPPRRLRADVPRDLETICLKCLEKEPERRYATAGDLADDLRRFQAGEPVLARPPGAVERAWKWCRRRPALAGALALAAASLVSVAVVSLVAAVRMQAEKDRAAAAEREHKLAVAQTLLTAAPDSVPYLLETLAPSAELVLPALRERCDDPGEDFRRRLRAAVALTTLGEPRTEFLLEAVPRAPPTECGNLARAFRSAAGPDLVEELLRRARGAPKVAERVRWAVLLLDLGEQRAARELLAPVADPGLRSTLIDTFPSWHGDLAALPDLLRKGDDAECRSGLCAALGRVDPSALRAEVRQELTAVLKELYQQAPDGGTHGAAGWALRQWGEVLPALEPAAAPAGGRGWFVNRSGLTMVRVPSGGFRTGRTLVVLPRPYFVSDREVSIVQFREFVEDSNTPAADRPRGWPGPDPRSSPDDHPVNNVSREDMLPFCNWLSLREGRKPCYRRKAGGAGGWDWDDAADGYRLPTEAEWDHAHRAGAATAFFFGDDARWLPAYAQVAETRTAPCGSKLPNRWGLFDMIGNLWEVCWDAKGDWSPGVLFDPRGPGDGAEWRQRGGAFDSGSYDCRSDHRIYAFQDARYYSRGFRVACAAGEGGREVVPDKADILRAHCDRMLRASRWKEAAVDLARVVELDANDHESAYRCAPLLLQAGDEMGYRRHCARLLERFGRTTDPQVAERTAKACLLIPEAVADLAPVVRLCEQAVTAGERQPTFPYFALARGMAAFRMGRDADALVWLRRSQASPALNPNPRTLALLFEGMAQHRLGRTAEANQTLEKAAGMMKKPQEWGKARLDDDWHDVLMTWVVHREAQVLCRPDGPPRP